MTRAPSGTSSGEAARVLSSLFASGYGLGALLGAAGGTHVRRCRQIELQVGVGQHH